MPKKRRASKPKRFVITAAAIDAYRAGDELALHRALDLRPWEINPLWVDDGPCPYSPLTGGGISWPQAIELKRLLEESL